jgi:Zn-dependent protease
MKIAFAGPASNIILALCGSILMKFAIMTHVPYLPDMLYIFIYTNVSLALFNMMPVDPLDGFKIVSGLLSNEQAHRWDSLRQYGPLFFILLFFPVVSSTPPAQIVLVPLIALVMKFLG